MCYRFLRPNMRANRSPIDLGGLTSIRFDLSGRGRIAICSAVEYGDLLSTSTAWTVATWCPSRVHRRAGLERGVGDRVGSFGRAASLLLPD